jgi:hypothetical protein
MSASLSCDFCEHCEQHVDECDCLHCSECSEWIATAFYADDRHGVCGLCRRERGDFDIDEDKMALLQFGREY